MIFFLTKTKTKQLGRAILVSNIPEAFKECLNDNQHLKEIVFGLTKKKLFFIVFFMYKKIKTKIVSCKNSLHNYIEFLESLKHNKTLTSLCISFSL